MYYKEFQEDFEGLNGRSKKTLWLTEVAGGTNNGTEQAAFAAALMSTTGGLADRTKYDFVERVSWFSEFNFPGFNVSVSTPAACVA